jgi:outer membrane protein OmpU
MKKILLASTALVLSAGIASAQGVTITGSGRMGVVGGDSATGWRWSQEHRLDLNFNVSVEADHGLTFGAWTRARTEGGIPGVGAGTISGNASGAGAFSGSRVWVESNGFRLTFGNQDGAIITAGSAMGYAGGCGVGYTGGHLCGDSINALGGLQLQNSRGVMAGFIAPGATTGRHRAQAMYNFGSSRVAISYDRDLGTTEFGARTTFNAFTVALGYSNIGTDIWALSGLYNGGSWGVGLLVADLMGTTQVTLSGNVDLGGGNLYGFYTDAGAVNVYGLSYGYSLGGGATLTAGYEATNTNIDTLSVGVAFSF